jgi:hypothetical protein
MRHWHWLVLGGVFVATPWAAPSPVEPEKPNLNVNIPGYASLISLVPCKGGGERTVAIASTTKTRGLLAMYVYDPHGNCIARDEYTERALPGDRKPATDDAAVEWFPPLADTYTVELRNQANEVAILQMAIR